MWSTDKKKIRTVLAYLYPIMFTASMNNTSKIQKIMKIHALTIECYLCRFSIFLVYENNWIAQALYGGNITFNPIHCFEATKPIIGWSFRQLFHMIHFYASSDLLMAYGTMELRFLKLGTVLTYMYAFKIDP